MGNTTAQKLMHTTLATLIALVVLTATSTAAPVISWGSGTWTNNGGVTYQTGYNDSSTSGSTTTDGTLTVGVAWSSYGTATGVSGENLTVSNVLSAGLSNPPSLRLQQNNDSNSGTMSNYTKLTLTFPTLVTLTSSFIIYDVDRVASGLSWADFVSVVATNNGSAVTTVYTVSPSYNQTTTYLGYDGVQGIASASNTSSQGNLLISFGGQAFDKIEIIFSQRSGYGSSSHGIGISNIGLTLVPEPASSSLVVLAGLVLGLARRFRAVRA